MNDAKLALLIGTVAVTVAALIVAGIMQARSRAKNKQSIPEEQYNALITDVNALRPSDPPPDVPAKAGNNIMRITEDYLFVRTASGSMYGGRASMSWWATFLTIMILLFPLIALLVFLLDSLHYLLVEGMSFHDSFFYFWHRPYRQGRCPDLFGYSPFLVSCHVLDIRWLASAATHHFQPQGAHGDVLAG
ncbi:MAG: hypothetical protein LBU11_07590 [Zoogloeaceae bacterium]|jgi:hypothetical protein|nr:hypothetical protein [Zoogloeaceae bacterium]